MNGKFRNRALAAAVFSVLVFSALGAPAARAADDVLTLSVADALASPDAKKSLNGSVAFYFGKTSHPSVQQQLGEFVSNKKSNAFAKADSKSCNRAMVSALIAFQKRAVSLGGNAVVNIRSYYDKNEVSLDHEFECHSGFLMSGVALKGEVVKLKP